MASLQKQIDSAIQVICARGHATNDILYLELAKALAAINKQIRELEAKANK